MRHRIFIAINLPENVKKKLAEFQSIWPELPIRWTKKDNLHITLKFLGYISEEELLEVCQLATQVAERNEPFSISLKKIIYGPPKKTPPRMVWVEGERSEEFARLRDDLESSLLGSDKVRFSAEKRAFSPHITLGRVRVFEWRQMEPEERPEVGEEINLTFEVNSIEVMESQLKKGGSEYFVLESCQLKS